MSDKFTRFFAHSPALRSTIGKYLSVLDWQAISQTSKQNHKFCNEASYFWWMKFNYYCPTVLKSKPLDFNKNQSSWYDLFKEYFQQENVGLSHFLPHLIFYFFKENRLSELSKYPERLQAFYSWHVKNHIMADKTEQLHLATQCYQPANVLETLIQQGADPNGRDHQGYTPLMRATINGNEALVTYFLNQQQVRLYEEDNNGNNCLHLAAKFRRLEVVKILITEIVLDVINNSGETPLHFAAINGDIETADYLLTQKADVNSQYDQYDLEYFKGRTPLHCAAQAGQLDMVKYLISHGANIHLIYKENNEAKTPLELAKAYQQTEVVEYLESLSQTRTVPLTSDSQKDDELVSRPLKRLK